MKVSVWVGNTTSWESLDSRLTFTFTQDGDAIPCPFCLAFGFDWFDDDFREASHTHEATRHIHELLRRHSHGDKIADALSPTSMLVEPCNAVVVLYEFEAVVLVETADLGDGTTLCFLGCVDVQLPE